MQIPLSAVVSASVFAHVARQTKILGCARLPVQTSNVMRTGKARAISAGLLPCFDRLFLEVNAIEVKGERQDCDGGGGQTEKRV